MNIVYDWSDEQAELCLVEQHGPDNKPFEVSSIDMAELIVDELEAQRCRDGIRYGLPTFMQTKGECYG